MIHSLCFFACGRRSHVLRVGSSGSMALFALLACSAMLPSCTISRTSARISETGARYDYADCGTLEKNVLLEKDGCYYVKARKRVCERKQDLWGTMAVALNYWGCRDVPLPDDEQPDEYVTVRIPLDLALRMSGRRAAKGRSGEEKRSLPASFLQTMPKADLSGAKEVAIRHPLNDVGGCRIAGESCYHRTPPLYVYDGRRTNGLHLWMQPVAWLDAVVVDVPLSVAATPVRWMAAGYRALFSES